MKTDFDFNSLSPKQKAYTISLLTNGITLSSIKSSLDAETTENGKTAKLKSLLETNEIPLPISKKKESSKYPSLDMVFGKTIAEQILNIYNFNTAEAIDVSSIENKTGKELFEDASSLDLITKQYAYLSLKKLGMQSLETAKELGVDINLSKLNEQLKTESSKKKKKSDTSSATEEKSN